MIRLLMLRDFRSFCNRLNNNIRDIFSYLPERVCLKLSFLIGFVRSVLLYLIPLLSVLYTIFEKSVYLEFLLFLNCYGSSFILNNRLNIQGGLGYPERLLKMSSNKSFFYFFKRGNVLLVYNFLAFIFVEALLLLINKEFFHLLALLAVLSVGKNIIERRHLFFNLINSLAIILLAINVKNSISKIIWSVLDNDADKLLKILLGIDVSRLFKEMLLTIIALSVIFDLFSIKSFKRRKETMATNKFLAEWSIKTRGLSNYFIAPPYSKVFNDVFLIPVIVIVSVFSILNYPFKEEIQLLIFEITFYFYLSYLVEKLWYFLCLFANKKEKNIFLMSFKNFFFKLLEKIFTLFIISVPMLVLFLTLINERTLFLLSVPISLVLSLVQESTILIDYQSLAVDKTMSVKAVYNPFIYLALLVLMGLTQIVNKAEDLDISEMFFIKVYIAIFILFTSYLFGKAVVQLRGEKKI
ncbi:hypothetical protein [Lactococcus ileimucosae]|uniref:hypothetical protein n=1 Tax=Lactococcus ileimucosae TaxID=2941329 RepID=UPI00351853E7